jgi:hypothetical protein
MKLQEAAKVKGQKRRVADCSERPQYTDEEVAKLVDYDYGCLLDMIYYKLESMRDFFMSKHAHCVDAKKYAKQMEVAMRLISIAQGKDAFFDDDEDAPYVNTKNYKRYEKQFYSCHSLRKEKAWRVLFRYLESRMKGWWD